MTTPAVAQQDSEETFDRLVDEGTQRLGRTWTGLTATALLGGIDVGAGAIALLIVEHYTHSVVLAGLAFSIGFIALTLAHSELFTEGFLVPVAAVVAKKANLAALLRLWVMSIVGNLVGGWVIMGIAMAAFPNLRAVALEGGKYYISLGFSTRAFALAVIGGFVITLMTHMQHSTDSDGVKLVPAIAMGFLLGAGKLNHAIVASLLTFAALHVGAPFGYVDWLKLFLLGCAGNMVGGLGLVTVLRLLQVPHKVAAEREEGDPPSGVPGVKGTQATEPD
jgi:formate/nitrite transporter FocA (FNT family)